MLKKRFELYHSIGIGCQYFSQYKSYLFDHFFFESYFYKEDRSLYNDNPILTLKGNTMKKTIFLLMSIFSIAACSQSKNIYFNGAEGSHSGLRYSTTDKSFSLNP